MPKKKPFVPKGKGTSSDREENKRGSRSREDYRHGPEDLRRGPNDIKWRTGNGLSTKLAATLPTYFPAGLNTGRILIEPGTAGANDTEAGYVIPGIMMLLTNLTLGDARDYNAGLNLASRQIYSFVRHANSGSRNYEAADQTLIFGAIGQALGLLGWLKRVYLTITKFSSTSRYQPREILTTQNVDYDNICQHQAELAWLIRWFGEAIKSINVPNLPYFHACYQAFQRYYIDSDSPKAQVYIVNPYQFLVYNPAFSQTGGALKPYTTQTYWKPASGSLGNMMTYSDLYNFVHVLMDVLLSDEDVGIVSGDILKAYGDNLFKVADMLESDELYVKSEEILQQIHNCQVLTGLIGNDFPTYEEDPGSTGTAPYVKSVLSSSIGTITGALTKFFIDAFSGDPTPEEIVNCTVFKPGFHFSISGTGSSATVVYDATKTSFDLFYPIGIYTVSGLGTNIIFDNLIQPGACNFASWSAPNGKFIITNFDWHPLCFAVDTLKHHHMVALGDIQNINWYDVNVLDRIHDNSILSLFGFGVDKPNI